MLRIEAYELKSTNITSNVENEATFTQDDASLCDFSTLKKLK